MPPMLSKTQTWPGMTPVGAGDAQGQPSGRLRRAFRALNVDVCAEGKAEGDSAGERARPLPHPRKDRGGRVP